MGHGITDEHIFLSFFHLLGNDDCGSDLVDTPSYGCLLSRSEALGVCLEWEAICQGVSSVRDHVARHSKGR